MVEANVKAVKMVEVVEVVEAELELLVELADMIKSCIEAEVEIVEAGVDLIVGCRLGGASPLPVAAIFGKKNVEKLKLKNLACTWELHPRWCGLQILYFAISVMACVQIFN